MAVSFSILMAVSFSILIALLLFGLLFYTMAWYEHRSDAINNYDRKQYGYASFTRFLQEFTNYEKTLTINVQEDGTMYASELTKSYDCKEKLWIYCDIIRFDGIYMIIHYHDYWQFLIWKRIYIRTHKASREISWSKAK